MDLRTRLVFALVAVSLGTMLALGVVGYTRARDLLRDQAREKLEGVAESKTDALQNVKRAWRDRVRLIASRTQLRLSLDTYRRTHADVERERIAQIIEDATSSVVTVCRITVFDADGHVVTRTGGVPASADPDPGGVLTPSEEVVFRGLALGPDGELEIAFVTGLTREHQLVGALEIVMSATELIEVTGDHTGLGETGETLIVHRLGADSAVIVNPVRHTQGQPLGHRVALHDPNPVALALEPGTARPLTSVDYRGQEVLSASRFLPDFGWALIVKVDADEQESGVLELRRDMIRLALSIGAFAILIGTLLGLQLAGPIRHLADVANRIHAGELTARATIRSEDEIGMLARTFNQMAEKLIETNRELIERARGNDAEAERHATELDGNA
ncbi:MAG: HAMP domain-containing protein [Gemmatimonadetes bacterium]|nr:HAMP domain-containing protein [Gemmatimonadota bacterium]